MALTILSSKAIPRDSYSVATWRPTSRKSPCENLRMFALWTSVTLRRPWLYGILEGISDHPFRTRAGDESPFTRRPPGWSSPIPDVVLNADIEALGVLPHEHDIDLVESTAPHDDVGWSHIGVEVEGRCGAPR